MFANSRTRFGLFIFLESTLIMSKHAPTDQFTVAIRDESIPRSDVVETLLAVSCSKLSARDLISERVRMEIDNRALSNDGGAALPLVEATLREKLLNGTKRKRVGHVNIDAEIDAALSAFESNKFILLVDDHQIEALETQIELNPQTIVTFLKLTPMVGG